jgi:hypothetical protein
MPQLKSKNLPHFTIGIDPRMPSEVLPREYSLYGKKVMLVSKEKVSYNTVRYYFKAL